MTLGKDSTLAGSMRGLLDARMLATTLAATAVPTASLVGAGAQRNVMQPERMKVEALQEGMPLTTSGNGDVTDCSESSDA